jgi:hypothetical protein
MTVRARFSLTASSSLSPQFLEAIRVTASWRPVLYRGWPELAESGLARKAPAF